MRRPKSLLVPALVGLAGLLVVAIVAVVVVRLSEDEGGPPIVIAAGGVYSDHYVSPSADVPAVLIATSEPVVLDGAKVEGPGTLIQIETGTPADVVVRNTKGKGKAPESGLARFLVADGGWRSLVVENNELITTAGIWAHAAEPETVRITHNEVRDIVGADLVQFVQFDKVTGPIQVAWNEVINEPGRSSVEDVVSLYQSGGTPDAPARIHDNFIWGAFPLPVDDDYSGGGIMVGDQGSDAGHVEVTANQVVGTTNYGISVVCGSNQRVSENVILSSGRTEDGDWIPATNVGLSMGSESRWGGGCVTYIDNTATDNDLGWQVEDGRNDSWTPDCDDCSGNTEREGEVTYDDEEAEYDRWREKSSDEDIGPIG
jgi:hypothetical protein